MKQSDLNQLHRDYAKFVNDNEVTTIQETRDSHDLPLTEECSIQRCDCCGTYTMGERHILTT